MAEGEGFSIGDPDDEGGRTGDDAPQKGGKRGRKPRSRDALAEMLGGVEFSRSPDGGAYASVRAESGTHREFMRVNSRAFRNWITLGYYRAEGRGLSGQALAETVALAEARALASDVVQRPWRRVALSDDGATIYLDLGGNNPAGERRAVEITSSGWQVIEAQAVHVAFLRSDDALPLPAPEADAANIETLRGFVPVNGDDDLVLVWTWIVCALRPFHGRGAYPVACIHGEEGSGKSEATRWLQGIVDPSSMTGRGLPREDRDMFVSAAARHVLAFDNLSGFNEAFADSFCRIATGGAFSARALHTDSDEVILSALKPLLLNGIPATLSGRSDLASRTLSLELERLRVRRPMGDLIADYQRALPGMLGLACDGLSAALRNIDRVTLPKDVRPEELRMLDAALWAEAAAEGLGIAPGKIATAWAANRTATSRALVESDDLARAIVALIQAEESRTGLAEWKGSPSELHAILCKDHATAEVQKRPSWPRTPSAMGNRLTRLAPALATVHDIDAKHGKGGADGARFWTVRKL